jgi:hypothetical protein
MTTLRSLAALACCVALAACSKQGVPDIAIPAPGTAVKFYNFATGGPNVNFYANETKLTGVSSTSGAELNSGTAFGSVAAGGLYMALAPGQYTLSGRITAVTDNGLPIANIPTTLADGKYYSVYLSGPYNTTTKQADYFIVEDPIPPDLDFSATTVRFVNAMSTATGPLTLWAKSTVSGDSAAIDGPIAYKSAGAFGTMPSGVYDLTARYSGSNTAVLSRTGVSFNVGHVYTVSGRAGTGTVLDNTANR